MTQYDPREAEAHPWSGRPLRTTRAREWLPTPWDSRGDDARDSLKWALGISAPQLHHYPPYHMCMQTGFRTKHLNTQISKSSGSSHKTPTVLVTVGATLATGSRPRIPALRARPPGRLTATASEPYVSACACVCWTRAACGCALSPLASALVFSPSSPRASV